LGSQSIPDIVAAAFASLVGIGHASPLPAVATHMQAMTRQATRRWGNRFIDVAIHAWESVRLISYFGVGQKKLARQEWFARPIEKRSLAQGQSPAASGVRDGSPKGGDSPLAPFTTARRASARAPNLS